MTENENTMQRLAHTVHQYFLPLLLLSYVLAAVLPQAGLALRHLSFGSVVLPGMGATKLSPALLMLSFLLFNAGLGIKVEELRSLRHSPHLLLVGFLANMAVPILLLFGVRELMGLWHNQDELQNVLTGLALVVAMPIAGSSAAWTQNANGNMGLSLGLVLLSTILSPLTTPVVLHTFGMMTTGDYAEDLHELAQQGTNAFLCLTVVLPTLAGLVVRQLVGEDKTTALKPILKLSNFVVLLVLNYSNASTSLPQAFAKPDWDFLGLILISTVTVCAVAFFAGWLVADVFRSDKSDRASLLFSLGMNNNGTGLVLAATALADHPAVLLPMIFYTLVQQLMAAVIDWKIFKNGD